MSRISSNSLFHFTKPEYLKGILENNFIPRWNLEKFTYNHKTYIMGIPMVCFCDIPLGQIQNHIKEYGQCGIGMKKEWANNNAINPVFYIDEKSEILELFIESVQYAHGLHGINENDFFEHRIIKDIIKYLLKMNCYLKMVNGISSKNGEPKKFYDEREWRYVPDISGTTANSYIIPENECLNRDFIETENSKIKNLKLEFEPSDINYIIIEKESDRMSIINEIDSAKWNYSDNEKIILKSKILTSEQICNDF